MRNREYLMELKYDPQTTVPGQKATLTLTLQKFSNCPVMIDGILKKDGKEINPSTLDNYLGAKAHVVVVSVDDKEYIHVHPDVENGRHKLHTSFHKQTI